jgi:aminoglycoside 3-N-acetyltransferase
VATVAIVTVMLVAAAPPRWGWRTFSDIDTLEGALPYERVLGEEPYVKHIARSALAAGAGRRGPVGEATAHLFDARGLVEHAVGWIERNFPSGGSTDLG